jgi:hypothetical protein
MNAPQRDFAVDIETGLESHAPGPKVWPWEQWAIGGLVLSAFANAVYLLLTW